MLLPLVWGHSKHLGFCLALSYISRLSIFKILSMAIFLCVSFSLHTHANPSQKKKKKSGKKRKKKKKSVGCGRNDCTITASLEYVFLINWI